MTKYEDIKEWNYDLKKITTDKWNIPNEFPRAIIHLENDSEMSLQINLLKYKIRTLKI